MKKKIDHSSLIYSSLPFSLHRGGAVSQFCLKVPSLKPSQVRSMMAKGDRSSIPPLLVNRIREELGLSQMSFGNLFGVTDRSVYGWESGRNKPSGDNIKRLWKMCDELWGDK